MGGGKLPSGKTHEKINKLLMQSVINFIFLFFIYLFFGEYYLILAFSITAGYYFGTFYFGPDLDLPSRPYYRWKIFRFIWIPYQKMFAHRSFWTHGLLIGDIIRIFYVSFIILSIYLVSITIFGLNSEILNKKIIDYVKINEMAFILFISGIVISSTVHIFSDHLVSKYKRRRNKKRKKHLRR
jgi:uncharacterized metal-binding protein